MYLAQLHVHLTDGKLLKPFTQMPTSDPFEDYKEIEYPGEPKREVKKVIVTHEISNRELPLDELNHVSTDERTYIAIQSLENGTTLFGYVAVTIGNNSDASPLWVNAQGENM